MASITKYRAGYRAQVFVGGVRDSATFRLKREAEIWAHKREEELRNPAAVVSSLRQALERYVEEVSPTKRGERWEIVRIASFLKSSLPIDSPINEITPEILGRWRDERRRVVKPGSVLRDCSLLSAIFETARREWRWIAVNPMADMRRPREPAHRAVVITPWQALKMLRVMGYHRGPCKSSTQAVCVAFLLALRTGMRAGELCGLKWADVEDGFCRLPITKTVARDVPLAGKAMRLVESMRGWDRVKVLGLSSQTLDALFRRYRQRAGLSGFTFHDARHTAATLLARRLDVLTLCKMFGWKSTSQALTYYNPTPAQIKRMLERPRAA